MRASLAHPAPFPHGPLPRFNPLHCAGIFRRCRQQHGWRQEEAAHALGLSVQRLRALEHGTCLTVDADTLLRAASVYGTALETFFYEGDFNREVWHLTDVFARLELFLQGQGMDDALALARVMISSESCGAA